VERIVFPPGILALSGKVTDDRTLIGRSHKGSIDNVEIAHGVVLDPGHVNISVGLPRF
jgi:hypothetical protein